MAPRLNRLVSLCSGSFFLDEAGLLDGKRATTHWSVSERLSRRYPGITVAPDAIFIKEGAIWTSAGVTAAIDLALALVEEDLGRDLALAVARDLVVYLKRPGGQSQFSMHLASQMTNHPTIRGVQDWILQHLTDKLATPDLAKHASMSTRNFTRMFSAATGYSPAAFIEVARFELAQRLLGDAELPLKSIAASCGFTSDDQLRRMFQRRLGITPRAYRERFSTTGVGAAQPVPLTPGT
ncbi:AraC family transcriptional regulator [Pandoraea terrae]|uniref:AraC family transcriptional regulator n=1 Tax=Pandoraea terrae TaxID=1537710 RepID=A0A5E4UA79_9BURK|nr:AraC family transcriptional regulator [Pandoraea terrae]